MTDAAADFGFDSRTNQLRFRRVVLAERSWLTPEYVRIRMRGDDLAGFDSPGDDDHIRLFFPSDPAADLGTIRQSPSREYTPLDWGRDAEGHWLDVEFALHGGAGIAAPWARNAPVGAAVGVGGPRGSKVLVGRPGSWLLAGDETAVPAMRRLARRMDAGAAGRILVEVSDAEHDLAIDAPPGVRVEHVHRGTGAPGSTLVARLDAIGADERPEGSVFGFVAAEQSVVRPGRALLLERWGLDPSSVTVKGYWKRGEAEYHASH